MASAGTGDSEHLRLAWEAHSARLWRAILAWAGDQDVASESVAEAFAQAARRGSAIDDVGRWVWRAAFRIAAGILAERRRSVSGDLLEEQSSDDALPDQVVSLIDALERLRLRDREVLLLAHVGGWTAAEIASLVGSSEGAVRVRLHRARRRLRRELEVHDG